MIGNAAWGRGQCEFTNAYQISSITGAITRWIWFGLVAAYHCLPCLRSGFEPRPEYYYQSLPPHRRHNTQWIRLCVMLGYNGLWCGCYDWHLYDVGILLVWSTILINECLGVSYGMEVGRVWVQAFKCCLTIDDIVQAFRHRHLHGLGVCVLVRLVVFIVWHRVLLCYALIVAQNRRPSTGQTRVMMWLGLHLTENFLSGRSACNFYGMVVKLVGQW